MKKKKFNKKFLSLGMKFAINGKYYYNASDYYARNAISIACVGCPCYKNDSCSDIDGARGMPTGYNCPSNRGKSIGEMLCASKKEWLNLKKKMNKSKKR